ncbi:MAG: hypothetical protein J6P73_00450 [Bacteroidales bacterium]|nr:hypothetical protein [Bacteroidales bacterium]
MRKWITVIAALTVLGVLSGCLKDSLDNKTVMLFGEEAYVKTFKEVFGLGLNDTIQLKIIGKDTSCLYLDSIIPGLRDIYDKTQTPDVRGEYLFISSPRPAYSTVQHLNVFDTVFFRLGGDFDAYNDYIHGQHHLITHCDIQIPGHLNVDAKLYHADTAYVMGKDTEFVVFFEHKVKTPDYLLTQGIAIKGNLDLSNKVYIVDSLKDGVDTVKIGYPILDTYVAFYNKGVEPETPNIKGQLFVLKNTVTQVNRVRTRPWVDWNK